MNLSNDDWIKIIIGVLTPIVIAIWKWGRKIPARIKVHIDEKKKKELIAKHIATVKAGSKINNIIDHLGMQSGALYVHIIRYHNGGMPLEPGHQLNMTVEWEEPGNPCPECSIRCNLYKKVPRIQQQWRAVPVTGTWFDVISRTLDHRDSVTTFNFEDMDGEHKDIWKSLGIVLYKEVFLTHTAMGFYTIGLSFCQRLRKVNNIDGLMMHAAGRLKQLL